MRVPVANKWVSRAVVVTAIFTVVSQSCTLPSAAGQDTSPQFERDVLPLLTAHCLKCHGLEARKSGLDLRTPALMRRGGDNGPVLVADSAEESPLYEQIAAGTMPPDDETKLTDEQIETVRLWIDAGAPALRPDTPLTDA